MAQSTVCKVMSQSDGADTYRHLADVRWPVAGHRQPLRRAMDEA